MPGHAGFLDNEKTDALAREGSKDIFIDNKPFCVLSRNLIQATIKD